MEAARAEVAGLEVQRERWRDPAYIAAQARERLMFVFPGEIGYVAIGTSVPEEQPAVRGDATDQSWYERLWRGLEPLGGVQRNGHPRQRLAHNLNVTVAAVEGGALHRALRHALAVSSGSACSQGSPSHVLAALGRSRQEAAASIRFGLGRGTTEEEIDRAVMVVAEVVQRLRAASAGGV